MDFSHLQSLKIYKLRFDCRAVTLLEAGPFWGSMLHGVLGQALRKQLCSNGNPQCIDCQDKSDCNYWRIFFNEASPNQAHARKYAEPPQPFIIRKDVYDRTLFLPGTPFSFGLVMIGHAIRDLQYFIDAFRLAGEIGMGRLAGKFEIVAVLTDSTGNDTYAPLDGNQNPIPVDLQPIFGMPQTISWARMQFVAPLHIKDKGQPAATPGAGLLLHRIYERLILLNHFYCGGALTEGDDYNFPAPETTYDLHKYPFARFSNRHGKRLDLSGIIGTIELRGELTTLYPLLALGQYVNLGKMAALGLGQYRLAYG
jgi:hypothetical protein